MITGFNTDISSEGTTYHVQTEDKGPANPLILSLIYVRGAILAAKRTSYAKEVAQGITEEQLQVMLDKQHRTILAVIKAGRIQELVEKLNKMRPTEDLSQAVKNYPDLPIPPAIPVMPFSPPPELETYHAPVIAPEPVNEPLVEQPAYSPVADFYTPPPANPVAQVVEPHIDSAPAFAEFDLDKIILDYLKTDTIENRLQIRILGRTDFYAGEAILLQLEVVQNGVRIAGLPVVVKVIGTAFKPQVYAGHTGNDGIAVVPVTLPLFTAGSAAIVVQASLESGEAEARYMIRRR